MVRKLLLAAAALVLLLCAGGVALGAWVWDRTSVSTVGKVEFTNPLAIPPLAPSRVDEQGRRVFELRAQTGTRDFGRGRTVTWGFNGDYLGPTLRATRGEQVVVNVHNALNETTTVHWHGMHLPARMDGGPHQPIRPGATWSPTWRVDQPAATLWYHPHPHGQTEKHVYRGLAGMFILDDPATGGRDLPDEYGVDDIPVIVQDKRFTRDGQFHTGRRFFNDLGILGDTLLVNGTVGPYLDVRTERIRLRLLNGSTARVYDFGFADGRSFALVGTDGGLLAAPHTTARVTLAPGERAEIVVTVRPGERTVLRGFPPAGVDRFVGGADEFDVLQLRAADTLKASPPVPARLVDVPRLDPADAAQTRTFRMSGHRINGRAMDMGRIDVVITRDTVEVWDVVNAHGTPHSFHVHDVQFQVLQVDGHEPPPHLRGWKDTVFLSPGTRMRIIARFADYADPAMPYMYHCHMLYHEDNGMMGQFVVVAPGQRPQLPSGGAGQDHHHHD